ncbi:hypothetical protein [Nocardia sp. NPDC003726]
MTTSKNRRYEEAEAEWIARQLENAPPLNERQKELIRSIFAAHRREREEAERRAAAAARPNRRTRRANEGRGGTSIR